MGERIPFLYVMLNNFLEKYFGIFSRSSYLPSLFHFLLLRTRVTVVLNPFKSLRAFILRINKNFWHNLIKGIHLKRNRLFDEAGCWRQGPPTPYRMINEYQVVLILLFRHLFSHMFSHLLYTYRVKNQCFWLWI